MAEYLFIAFIVVFCIQFIYYIFIFGSFAFRKKKILKSNFNQPISVVICAKNEAQNLSKNLPFLLKQNYNTFELVLINDCSKDTTLDVLKKFKKEFPTKIKIIDVKSNEQFWGSKKYALTLGIKAATHEHLLFTDADCKPISKNWISKMVTNFNNQHQLILGYGAYEKTEKSFLNKLIRFETLLTAIQYFSYSKIGIPYMGVGRNLAYTKTLFLKNNGFVTHIKIKSGDDDLFINQVATTQNTVNCYSKNSFTISTPKNTFKEWLQQKRRHVSTASHYKSYHKFLLGIFYGSQFLFWFLSLLLISILHKWQLVLILVFSRILIQYLVIGSSAKKLNEKDLILLSPFLELFLIITQMFIFIKNLISKPTHW
ncbi:MAG: glycosyltransferase [Lutibacter sp.]|uniref:glycosyltransferase n=1 Tax=Lutibacter sp. TaxID=1925666 RepID=UPI00385B9207